MRAEHQAIWPRYTGYKMQIRSNMEWTIPLSDLRQATGVHCNDRTRQCIMQVVLHATIHSAKKATIHQVTTMLATSKNVLSGHNHLLTTSVDDQTIQLSTEHQRVKGSALVVSRWLWPGNRTFSEVDSMVVNLWIVAFWATIIVSVAAKIWAKLIENEKS